MRRWTVRGALARTKRQLDAAQSHLANIALEWGDVDQGYVDEAESMIRELTEFWHRMQREVAERQAAGEHIGI